MPRRKNTHTTPPPPHDSSNERLLEPPHEYLAGNALVRGDNYDVLRQLPDECVDLIYLDPPFNSNQFYVAAFGDKGRVGRQLRDIWRWNAGSERAFQEIEARAFTNSSYKRLLDCIKGVRLQAGETSDMAAYILYMARRLMEMRRVLKRTGSIYLHCDPHANAYLRILMDAVFSSDNFRNHITWERHTSAQRGSQHNPRTWGNTTDTLLFYAKSKVARLNPYKDLTEEQSSSKFPLKDKHGRRYYNDSSHIWSSPNMGARPNLCYEWRGYCNPHPSGWRLSKKRLEEEYQKGNIVILSDGKLQRRKYEDDWRGTTIGSLWNDINPAAGSERLGYPTQKPRALLERIIKASSNPGDLVLDPFCGCGTAADAAASLGRKYLGIDISGIAVRVMQQRLESRGETAAPVVYGLEWTDFEWREFEERALMSRDDAEDGTPGWEWAEDKVAALLNAVPNEVKVGDGGIDAHYFGAMDAERNEGIIIPIQVKMWRSDRPVGRPDMDRLLGVQTALRNKGRHAPMSLMVSLYPPTESLRSFAAQQGRVTLTTMDGGSAEYPVMQAISVKEMLLRDERPKLPPVDPRSLVGDTQDKMLLV